MTVPAQLNYFRLDWLGFPFFVFNAILIRVTVFAQRFTLSLITGSIAVTH